MASTLIIGIGSTGLKMIEHAQQFHYEFTGLNRPGENVEYVFLETDINRKPLETASGKTDINDIYVSLQANAATINNLKSNSSVDSDWIPDASAVLSKGEGAGGLSSYGRLSIWGDSNLSVVKGNIQTLYSKIGGDEKTNIFVVGTLTGGTGSGLCVDIAYLIREVTGCNNIYGMFLMPDRSSFLSDKIVHENSLCALMALNYYSKAKNDYKINWPHGKLDGRQKPPYTYIHTLSTEFDGQRAAMKSVSELFRTAGMILCMNILDTNDPNQKGFTGLINARRVDKKANDLLQMFYTTGFSVIQYPKSQIEELVAISISKAELEKLVDQQNYINHSGDKIPIANDKNDIQRAKHKEIEDVIATALEDLNEVKGPDSVDVQSNIKVCVSKILKKNHGKSSSQKYIHDLFSNESEHNFYSSIKNNTSRCQDRLIEGVNTMITDTLGKYRNFQVIQLVLESIHDYIPKILNFYEKQYGIDGTDATWAKVLRIALPSIFKKAGNFALLQKKRTYFENELRNLVELSKINAIFNILSEMQERIIDAKNFSTTNGKKIATVKKINDIISEINQNIKGDSSTSLDSRKIELENNLDNKLSCFNFVFRKGSWDKDYNEAYSNFKSSPKRIKIQEILNTSDLWEYFIQDNYNLYRDSMKNTIDFVKANNFVDKDADLKSIVQNLSPDSNINKNIINFFNKQNDEIIKMLPSMTKVRSSFDQWHSHDKCPVYVLGNNVDELSQSMPNFKFKEDNCLSLPSLNNAVVFYKEFSYLGLNNGNVKVYDPIESTEYMQDVKNHLNKVMNDEFKLKRMPYLSIEESKEYLK